MHSAQQQWHEKGKTMRTSTTLGHMSALLSLAPLAQAFVPSLSPSRGLGHTRASRCRADVSCRMSLQTPPSQEKPAMGSTSTEVGKEKGADGLEAGKNKTGATSSPGDGGSKKRALGIKEPEEQDVMWKLKVR